MWEVRDAPSKGPTGHSKMTIDETRDVWIQPVGVMIGDPGRIFTLVWRGCAIPFDTIEESRRDGDGKEYIVVRLRSFGGSAFAFQYGIAPYRFNSDEERRQAMMLAVEALLAFGSDYNGCQQREGFYRVEHDGRLYTRGTFGIT